jgi:hypothetical protein
MPPTVDLENVSTKYTHWPNHTTTSAPTPYEISPCEFFPGLSKRLNDSLDREMCPAIMELVRPIPQFSSAKFEPQQVGRLSPSLTAYPIDSSVRSKVHTIQRCTYAKKCTGIAHFTPARDEVSDGRRTNLACARCE